MADKLTRRDGSIEKLNGRIKQLEAEIENKELEHKVTLDQVKDIHFLFKVKKFEAIHSFKVALLSGLL